MQKILVVDDDQDILDSTRDMLKQEYKVLLAGPKDPYENALKIWEHHPDLCIALVDLRMPGKRGVLTARVGFSLISDLKASRPDSRVAAYSAHQSQANLTEAARRGADGFIGKDWPPERVLANVGFLAAWTTAGSALRALYRSIELRNPYTAGHTTRVREYCRALIVHLREVMPDAIPDNKNGFDLAACLIAAELHDLGKLEMPDDILLGIDDGLTSEQRHVIERHVNAAKDLGDLGLGFDRVADIAYQHHRRYKDPGQDSLLTDYPKDSDLKRGDDIPFETRVMHVADVLDALLSDRSYRPGKTLEEAVRIIRKGSGDDFDPKVVKALDELLDKDRAWLERIVAAGTIRDELGLCLYFTDKRLTAGRLQTLLFMLSDVYLIEGKAIDRLSIRDVQLGEVGKEGATVMVKLAGMEKDVKETERILRARMEEDQNVRKTPLREMPDTEIRGLRSVPFDIETCPVEEL